MKHKLSQQNIFGMHIRNLLCSTKMANTSNHFLVNRRNFGSACAAVLKLTSLGQSLFPHQNHRRSVFADMPSTYTETLRRRVHAKSSFQSGALLMYFSPQAMGTRQSFRPLGSESKSSHVSVLSRPGRMSCILSTAMHQKQHKKGRKPVQPV